MASDSIDQRFRQAIIAKPMLVFFSGLVMLGSNWIASAVDFKACFAAAGEASTTPCLHGPGLAIGLAAFVLGSLLLYLGIRDYLLVRQLRKNQGVRPRAALILFLSPPGSRINPQLGQLEKDAKPPVPVSGDLTQDIAALEDHRSNLQHFLRVLAPHQQTVRRIVLMGSGGEGGSAEHFAAYRWLIQQYIQLPAEKISTATTRSEDVDTLYRDLVDELTQLVESEKFAWRDMIVDVTGGKKTDSIAAALATLHLPELEFQYISTEFPFSATSYDMALQAPYKPS